MTNCEKVRQGTKGCMITMRPLKFIRISLRSIKHWRLAWIPCWALLGLFNVESRGILHIVVYIRRLCLKAK